MNNGKIAAFGEIMLRLSAPAGVATESATAFDACYGGTEANVLACLNNFGHKVKYLTALPDNGMGHAVIKHLERFNIDTSDIVMGGDNLGVYFVENGSGSRGASVIYYRSGSEFTRLTESSFDFDKVLGGVTLFHISGISFALSKSSNALAFKLLDEAKKRGIKISFDFNYRAKLWTTDRAREEFVKAIDYADIVLASELDLDVFLKTDRAHYFDKYKNTEYLVLRNRRVEDGKTHSVEICVLHSSGGGIKSHIIPRTSFAVTEKVGGGDAFDGAVLHKIMCGGSEKEIAEFGVAAFMLKHGIAGDTFTLGGDAVEQKKTELFGGSKK